MDIKIYNKDDENDILRIKCVDVSKDDLMIPGIIAGMSEILSNSIGCGLSAPQVGYSLKIIVIDADKMGGWYPECQKYKRVLLNPVIVKTSRNTCVYGEGCLSIPGCIKMVKRPSSVTVEYLDESFNKHKEKFDGFNARIFLHEYDHLEGKLMIDYEDK